MKWLNCVFSKSNNNPFSIWKINKTNPYNKAHHHISDKLFSLAGERRTDKDNYRNSY